MAMRTVRLGSEADFNGWRDAVRALKGARVAPDEVAWMVAGEGEAARLPGLNEETPRFSVSRAFMELALAVFSSGAPERFGLLYRLLWRLDEEPGLIGRVGDPEVARALSLANQVRNRGGGSSVESGSTNGGANSMTHADPTTVSDRVAKSGARIERDGAYNQSAPISLEEVAAWSAKCRRCELWKNATQVVPGEGPARASVMLVGEQPGDAEDLAGRPFVGPAGELLDRALAAAGQPRAELYITNAVKHFTFEQRGKRRLHKTPVMHEISACRWWLEAERRLVKPRVIVALGATAAWSVFGKETPIKANRGKPHALTGRTQGVVTYHPSFVLRVPDERAKHDAYAALVEDLRLAGRLAD